MAQRLRLLGMFVVLVTSVVTAVSTGERWLFWVSIALALAAAAGAWRVLKEPAP